MSTLSVPSPTASSLVQRLVKRHPLAAYFVLAFAISWLVYLVPDALGSQGWLPFRVPLPLVILGGYGPTFAALIVTGLLSGGAGIRRLLSGLLVWRVNPVWYLAALFMHPILFLLGFAVYALTGGALPPLPQLSLGLALNIVLLLVVLGLINGEEIGWRGFALPRLQARHTALTANLVLGAIEALFHLPLFWTSDAPQAALGPVAFVVISLAAAILFAWIFNNTRGSLLLAYLVHAAQNTWTNVLPVGMSGPLLWYPLGMMALAAVVVVIVFGPARFSRKPASEYPAIH